MKKIALVAVGVFAALALSTSAASATLISGAGPITATFPRGGISFSSPLGLTLDCPIILRGTINATKTELPDGLVNIGQITSATVNPNPCNGHTLTFNLPASPWLIAALDLPGDGSIDALILGITVIVDGTIPFSGSVLANINGTAITNPNGTLTGPLGSATVGGTGSATALDHPVNLIP